MTLKSPLSLNMAILEISIIDCILIPSQSTFTMPFSILKTPTIF